MSTDTDNLDAELDELPYPPDDDDFDGEDEAEDAEDFVVTVGGGGGPQAFAGALARKFRRLIQRGNWCVILTPTLYPAPGRYVQALITPVGVRVESVGEHYLDAPGAELTEPQLVALEARGWLAPPGTDADPDWGWPYNWWFELTGPGALETAAGMLTVALIEVHDLAANEPVEINIFPTTTGNFRWETDPDSPCGGHLVPI